MATKTPEQPATVSEPEAAKPEPAKKAPSILDRIVDVDKLDMLDRVKLLITGPSGAGKSHFSASFKRPLIGLTEKQAVRTIKTANPRARIFLINTLDNLREFMAIASSPSLGDHCDAIVLDSLTDAQRIIKETLTKAQTKRQDITDQDTWGVVIDETARLARVIRDAVVHTVVICIDAETVMDSGVVHRPGVSGKKLPAELAQYVNAMAYARKDLVNGEPRRSLVFEAGPNYPTKSMAGLRNEEPNEAQWLLHQVFGTPVPDDVAARVAKWEEQGSNASALPQQKTGSGAFD